METNRILTLKINDVPGCVLTVRNNIDGLEILDNLIRDSRAEWELQSKTSGHCSITVVLFLSQEVKTQPKKAERKLSLPAHHLHRTVTNMDDEDENDDGSSVSEVTS